MSSKKYRLWVKVSNAKFVTYKSNDLLSFVRFLDKEFADWRFFNVYPYLKGEINNTELARFTKTNRPKTKHV